MARKRERAFALFGAALFLITSSALTIAVIYSATQNKKQSDGAASTPASSTKETRVNSNSTAPTGKLEGTQLSGFTPLAKIDSLQEQDIKPGNGEAVKPNATVTVDYTGAVAATGKIFQSSLDSGQPVTFPLNQVISGWTQGVPGMKVGGTRRLLIPAAMAYGANPPAGSGIPANADLVFDITLHSIAK